MDRSRIAEDRRRDRRTAAPVRQAGEKLSNYLSFGFIPDAELASDYVKELLAGPALSGSDDPAALLTDILADLTKDAPNIVIPLSGGRDSRALLGAALRVFAPSDIHCITFGSDRSADVEGARVACAGAGVSHEVIDPDTIEWKLDELTAEMGRRLGARQGTPPIDGMVVFGRLSELVPPEVPVLSGYLGIIAVGKHLGGHSNEEDEAVLERFFRQNRAILDERPQLFRDFLRDHEGLRRHSPGLAKFDLLDLGFRQRLRIRSSVTGSFARPVRPYEDRRWIAHWFSQPLEVRINYPRYDHLLAKAFPRIFGPQPLTARIQRWRARRVGRGVYRGDPRNNASMAAALGDACRSFDSRGYGLGVSAQDAFAAMMKEPSHVAFRRVRWFATAELIVRTQEIASAS
jgi:hypothetical protein